MSSDIHDELNGLYEDINGFSTDLDDLNDSVKDIVRKMEKIKDKANDEDERRFWYGLKDTKPFNNDKPIDSPVNQRQVEYFCKHYTGGNSYRTSRVIDRAVAVPDTAIAFRELDEDPDPFLYT